MQRIFGLAVVCLFAGCVPRHQGSSSSDDFASDDDSDEIVQSRGPSWRCTAEGSVGTAPADGGSWEYSTKRARGNGATRDLAYFKAFVDCRSLLTNSATHAISAGNRRDVGTCKVVDCTSER